MTTIEGNKLIAEFMGCYGDTHWSGGESVFRYGFKDTHITERWHESQFDEMTPYHSSWDWLMPVVEKIEDLGYSVFIQNDVCWIKVGRAGMKMPLISELGENKISATFAAITQFIQWYNTQTPQQ